MLKKLIPLMVLASIADADPYYNLTTIKSPNSLSKTFDVVSYGAKCDGTADDTTAINAAITAARTQHASNTFNAAVIIFPGKANCKVTGTVNATGFTNEGKNVTVLGNGATIYLNGNAAVPVWDMLGSKNMHIKDLSIYASSGFQTYGLQSGRADSTPNEGRQNTFEHLNISGSYTQAACYNFAGEDDIWIDMFCQNTNATSGYGFVQDGENHFNITSAFVTQTIAADTEQSFNSNTIIGGKFSSSAAGASPFWLEGTTGHHFIDAYGYNADNSGGNQGCYTLFNVASVVPFGNNRGLHLLGSHCEGAPGGAGPRFYILQDGPGVGNPHYTNTPTISGLEITEPYLSSTVQLFKRVAAAGIAGVTYEDLRLDLPAGSSGGSLRVFGSPVTDTVNGCYVHAYKLSLWDGPTSGCALNVAGNTTFGGQNNLFQWGIPVGIPPSGFFANNGVYVVGQAPSSSATLSVSATSGSVTATFSAATLLGTAADVGRVVTILDTTYKYCTITAQSSTTVATCTVSGGTLSGTGPFANASLWLSGTPTTNTSAFSVPLEAVYSPIYLYFGANVICSNSGNCGGSAQSAALFYSTCESTTVCTVKNNTLASGPPLAITSPTAFTSTGAGAFAQSQSQQTLLTLAIPANSMGTQGTLVVDLQGVRNTNTDTINFQAKYGGTTIGQQSSASNMWYSFYRRMRNTGSASAQVVFSSGTGATTDVTTNVNAPTRLAIDSSAAQNLTIHATDTTQPTNWFVMLGGNVNANYQP